MANLNTLFLRFNNELAITASKEARMISSKDNLRDCIRKYFKNNHPSYSPSFYIQGSYKLRTTIRTKEDKCDLDDGVYFVSNPDNVCGTTLQRWVKEAVEGITGSTPTHKKKCIRVDYSAGYNIDLPVFVFDKDRESHPNLAVKDSEFQKDDPKEFVDYFRIHKTDQIIRIIKYLKAWCDNKRESMPSGLAMTVLALKYYVQNDRDDVALRFTLTNIENALKNDFVCQMPTTPKDNLFADYSDVQKRNFMDNLSAFILDAKKALDDKNKLKASLYWKKHLGDRFPEGEDVCEHNEPSHLTSTIGLSRPYAFGV